MEAKNISRRGLLNIAGRELKADSGPILAFSGSMGARLDRRMLLSASLAALGLMCAPAAFAEADNEPGLGQQSFFWDQATVDLSGFFDPHDQLEQIMFGDQASSILLGPTGPRIRQMQVNQLNSTPNGESYAGLCFPTSIAIGDCPIIDGSKTVSGVTASWLDRMVYAPLYYSGAKVEIGWGKPPDPSSPYAQNVEERGTISAAEFQYLQDIQFANRAQGIRKHLVIETSDVRGKPGEQWWVYLREFKGNNLITTDFLAWNGLGNGPRRLDFQPFPYWLATRIVLVDPSQSHPGMEPIFNNTINKEVVASFLGI